MNPRIGRRTVLGAVAAGATIGLTPLPAAAHAEDGVRRNRIDVHGHHLPDFYAADLREHGYRGLLPDWSPGRAVAFMDEFGIAAQIVSITEPAVAYLGSVRARVAMAARINDWTRTTLLETTDPALAGRFGAFAVLPLGDPDEPGEVAAACTEAERAVTRLGFDGIGLLSSYSGVYLGDPRLDPLMRTLERLGVMVFVHPATPGTAPQVGRPAQPALLLEFAFDTTRAVVNMSYQQVFSRFPGIRWLLAHAGGTVPYLALRATLLSLQTPVPAANFDYGRLFYDTALAWGPETLRSTETVAGAGHILYATDWPYTGTVFDKAGDPLPKVEQTFTGEADLRKVLRDNAVTQFPRLAARLARAGRR